MKKRHPVATGLVAAAMGAAGGASMVATTQETIPDGTQFKMGPNSIIAFSAELESPDIDGAKIYKTIGELYFADGKLRFDGEAGPSAKMFFTDLMSIANDYCKDIEGAE